MENDAELLLRYARNEAEDAFAEIVRRHINFVYRTALRQLGGDAHHAADTAQYVFTEVARKAAALASYRVFKGWLFTTTCHAAANLVRTERRRQHREQEAHGMQTSASDGESPADWTAARPLINDALQALSARDREAVLLRYFENRNYAEIGARFSLTADAARLRVERALDKLHGLLAGRGIKSTTAALAATLAHESTLAAPMGLAASVTGAALADAAAAGSSGWAALMSFMSGTKSLLTLGAVLVLAVAAAHYEQGAENQARARLDVARQSHSRQEARLSELRTRVDLAERKRTALAGELRQQQSLTASARDAAQSAREAARVAEAKAEAERVAFNATAVPLLRFDPVLQDLRLRKHRWEVNEDYGRLFKEFHFTGEQTEKFVRLFADWTESRPDRGETFLLAPYVNGDIGTEEFIAKMRGEFGREVADRFRELDATRTSRLAVNVISFRLYYLDDPFTPQQADGLTQIFSAAGMPKLKKPGPDFGGPLRGLESLDWDFLLARAEPLLSGKQMEGLRVVAANARLEGLLKSAGAK